MRRIEFAKLDFFFSAVAAHLHGSLCRKVHSSAESKAAGEALKSAKKDGGSAEGEEEKDSNDGQKTAAAAEDKKKK